MSLDNELDRELVYRRLQGRSYAQIAAETGQAETALRSRWSSLRQRLRKGPCSRPDDSPANLGGDPILTD